MAELTAPLPERDGNDMSDLVWTPVKVRLGQIRPWDKNPRMSSKAQAERLIRSERNLGQIQTLAISPFDEQGFCDLYDGHQRHKAWFTVKGASFELWAMQSNRPLREEERREAAILVHTATGDWDWDDLQGWNAGELNEWGFDNEMLKGWKADVTALSEFIKSEKPTRDAEPQIDRAAELLEKWQVKRGDLFSVGAHKILCGDCTSAEDVKRLLDIEPDFSFTDPPYNVGIKYGEGTNDNQGKQEFIEWCHGWTTHLPGRHVLTVGIKRLCWWDDILGDPQWIISWVKRNGQGQTGLGGTNKWDAILVYGVEQDHKTDMIELNNDYSEDIKADGGHPTAKPVALWQQVIERFGGQVVYEPFSGSGTTMIACANLGSICRAMELEPAYVAVALERMSVAFPNLEIKRLE